MHIKHQLRPQVHNDHKVHNTTTWLRSTTTLGKASSRHQHNRWKRCLRLLARHHPTSLRCVGVRCHSQKMLTHHSPRVRSTSERQEARCPSSQKRRTRSQQQIWALRQCVIPQHLASCHHQARLRLLRQHCATSNRHPWSPARRGPLPALLGARVARCHEGPELRCSRARCWRHTNAQAHMVKHLQYACPRQNKLAAMLTSILLS